MSYVCFYVFLLIKIFFIFLIVPMALFFHRPLGMLRLAESSALYSQLSRLHIVLSYIWTLYLPHSFYYFLFFSFPFLCSLWCFWSLCNDVFLNLLFFSPIFIFSLFHYLLLLIILPSIIHNSLPFSIYQVIYLQINSSLIDYISAQ